MTVPEWVLMTMVGLILSIVGWAATRLVKSGDDQAEALGAMNTNLATINGRLGKTETWQLMHGDDDARRFQSISENQKELWHAVRELKPRETP